MARRVTKLPQPYTPGQFGFPVFASTSRTAITSKYRVASGTGYFEKRWMQVTPVRVG